MQKRKQLLSENAFDQFVQSAAVSSHGKILWMTVQWQDWSLSSIQFSRNIQGTNIMWEPVLTEITEATAAYSERMRKEFPNTVFSLEIRLNRSSACGHVSGMFVLTKTRCYPQTSDTNICLLFNGFWINAFRWIFAKRIWW